MNRVFAEADAIWRQTGIAFDWHRSTSTGAAHTWQLDVTIDDRRNGYVGWQAALGWIPFTADGPAPSIHLSRAGAEALICRTAGISDDTVFTHEILVGRALGRALSHELGHYLLKSSVHTPRGLMRAIWPSEQLLSIDRRGFELTAQQREAAAQHVQLDELTKSVP